MSLTNDFFSFEQLSSSFWIYMILMQNRRVWKEEFLGEWIKMGIAILDIVIWGEKLFVLEFHIFIFILLYFFIIIVFFF